MSALTWHCQCDGLQAPAQVSSVVSRVSGLGSPSQGRPFQNIVVACMGQPEQLSYLSFKEKCSQEREGQRKATESVLCW